MKKYLEAIGIISLVCISFFITDQTATVMKDVDQIMIEIKTRKDETELEPIDAVIEGNTIVPGLSGRTVDIEQSYQKMKRYGSYLERLLVYQEVKPKKSFQDDYNKYLIHGNPKKNMVSFIFLVEKDSNVSLIQKELEKTNTKASFFLDGTWFESHNQKVLQLIEDGYEVGNLSYNRNYQDSSFVWMDTIIKKVGKQKMSYCYQEEEKQADLELCALHKNPTIKPSIVVKENPYTEVKNQVTAGSIIAFPITNQVAKELSSIIRYIEAKGYTITTLQEHLKE